MEVLGATVAFAGLCGTAGVAVAGPARPNFVVIYSDDHTYRATGYRNPQVKTPHMDRLAAEGLRLDCMFTASPICAASRASAMTGMFPQQHGTVALHGAAFKETIVDGKRFPTLPQLLSKAGYRTALFGKSHLGDPTTYGFDEGRETKDQNDDESFPLAVEFLKRQASSGQPFFLWVSPHNPHLGFNAPQKFQDLYKDGPVTLDPNWRETPPVESLYSQGPAGQISFRDSGPGRMSGGPPRSAELTKNVIRGYYADVSCLDDCLGGFVAELKRMGVWTNTILIYTSDNGYHLGNHGLGNKITMHEESVRVPAFVVSPLVPAKGAVSEALVSTLDILPTLLDYAGVTAPPHLMGRSLRPVFGDPKATVRDHIVSECIGPPESRTGTGHRMVRDARYKYILTMADEEAFFDLQADPCETNNLIREVAQADAVDKRREQLKDWMNAVGEQRLRVPIETVVPAGTRSAKKQRQAAEKAAAKAGAAVAVPAAVERAHAEMWRRFIGPDNIVLDYAGLDGTIVRPTPDDCREHRPNALSWGVPVEDGPMLGGLYLDALCNRWKLTGDDADRAKARRVIDGLLFLASRGGPPGFIARGVATDGRTTHPMGSNDQTTPWLYGIWRYLREGIAEPVERAALEKRFIEVVTALDANGWRMPCNGGPSPYRGDFTRPTWESAPRLLFVMKAMHSLTGDGRWQERYLAAAREEVGKARRSRLEICRAGMIFDQGQGPRHSWTGSEGVVCLRALWEMETDPAMRAAFAEGLRGSAELAAQSLPLCREFDEARAGRFEHDWRVMNEAWRPQTNEAEAVAVALTGLKVQHRVSPRMVAEKDLVREPCFAAWIVTLSPDDAQVARHRAAVLGVIRAYPFERLFMSQFFPVESAWYRLALRAPAQAAASSTDAVAFSGR